jgi:hypothetical protein
MTQKMVKPELVTSLKDWIQYWPKTQNVEFSKETREPVVFRAVKRGDASRSIIKTIPWEREGDILTIVTQPKSYAPTLVAAAREQLYLFHRQQEIQRRAAVEELQKYESNLLEAWRKVRIHAKEGGTGSKEVLLQQAIEAEQLFHVKEQELGSLDRSIIERGRYTAIYEPPLPPALRSISLTAKPGLETGPVTISIEEDTK